MTSRPAYRPELDGLRAIAVMAVVLYHAGFETFSGGYAGVDVFFVISGFLITNLIVNEVRTTERFSFQAFYLRRIRRLFPALLSTVFFSAIIGFLVFSPARLEDFGGSGLAAIFSLSNFYFWSQADYFDAAAITKPLLHTWSLSVEEQFYLIWPGLCVFALAKWSRLSALALIALMGAASLMLAEYLLSVDRNAAFYLLPSRMVEMLLGAALVWVGSTDRVPALLREFGALCGLALIGAAILFFDHHTSFPGYSALLPCLGTVLVILFGDARFTGASLRHEGARFIGKISYSLYLVHWPLTVFYLQLIEPDPGVPGKILLVVLCLFVGWLQYTHIEQRFRSPSVGADPVFRLGTPALSVMLSVFLAVSYGLGGMTWRIPADRQAPTDREWRAHVNENFCDNYAPAGTFAGDNRDLVTCQNYRGKKNDIYIIGDSHALHLAPGFARRFGGYNVHVLYMNGCAPQSGFGGYLRLGDDAWTKACAERNRLAVETLASQGETNIIFSSAKRSSPRIIAPATRKMIAPLVNAGHRVTVLADFIRPGRSLANCRQVPAYVISDRTLSTHCVGDADIAAKELEYNRDFKRRFPQLVGVDDLQCLETACMFEYRGKQLFRDSHHLSPFGAEIFVRKLADRLTIRKNGKPPKGGDKSPEV